MCSGIVVLTFCVITSVPTVFLLTLSFSTDFWVEYTVNRDKIKQDTKNITGYSSILTNNANYFSRNWGLFRICYQGNETLFLKGGDNCVSEEGYEWSARSETDNWDNNYHMRKHLLRAHFILMIFAIFVALLGCILGGVGWAKEHIAIVTYAAGVMGLTTLISVAFMACFHVYRDLERNDINEAPFEKSWSTDPHLKANTRVGYGYSFYLAWVSCGASLLATVLFIAARMKMNDELRQKSRNSPRMNNDKRFCPNPKKQPEPFYVPYSPYQPMEQPMQPLVQEQQQQQQQQPNITVIHHNTSAVQNPQYAPSQQYSAGYTDQQYSAGYPNLQNTQQYTTGPKYSVDYSAMNFQ